MGALTLTITQTATDSVSNQTFTDACGAAIRTLKELYGCDVAVAIA